MMAASGSDWLTSDLATRDALACIGHGLSQFVFLLGMWRQAGRVLPVKKGSRNDREWSLRIVIAVTLAWSAIVLTAVVLDLAGRLSPLTFYGVLTVVGMIAAKRSKNAQFTGSTRTSVLTPRGMGIAWLALLAVSLAFTLWHGVLAFPDDQDSLAYHLPMVDHWIQYDTLRSRHGAFWYVPGNQELWTYWLVAAYSGDFYAGLSNAPVVLLLFASASDLMRQLKIPASFRWFAIVSLLANEVVLRQWVTQGNDVAVAALFLATLTLMVRGMQDEWRGGMVLACLAVGLLAGVKYYALGYAGVVALMLAVRGWSRHGITAAAWVFIGCLVCGLALAGFWYGRNWVWTGTPLYPKGFPALGLTDDWQEFRPGNERSALYRGADREVWWLLVKAWIKQTGLLTTLAVFAVPVISLTLWIWRKLKRETTPPIPSVDGSVQVACWLAWIVYLITPNVIEHIAETRDMIDSQYHSVRFGTTVGVVGTIVLARMMLDLSRRIGHRSVFAFVVPLTVIDIALRSHRITGAFRISGPLGIKTEMPLLVDFGPWWWLGLSAAFFAMLVLLFRTVWRPSLPLMVILGCACLCGMTFQRSRFWHRNFSDFYFQQWGVSVDQWTRKANLETGQWVAACLFRYYPTLGSARENRVIRPYRLMSKTEIEEYLQTWRPSHLIYRDEAKTNVLYYDGIIQRIREHPELFSIEEKRFQFVLVRIHEAEEQ